MEASKTLKEAVETALAGERRRVVDKAIEAARDYGWCNEVSDALTVVYGEDASLSAWMAGDYERRVWFHSDGFDCQGFDREQFDREGFNRMTGRNREGYDTRGVDVNGQTREGELHPDFCEQCKMVH